MDLPQHTRDQYCQTSERAERDYMFPPNDEPTLVSELERVQNQCAEQDSLNSSERHRPLVNYSSTDDSESDSSNQMAILQTMKTYSRIIISLVRWLNKHFRVSDNISSFY